MAKIDTLSDPFDTALAAFWTDYTNGLSTKTFSGGFLRLFRGNDGGSQAGFYTTATYDFSNSSIFVEIFDAQDEFFVDVLTIVSPYYDFGWSYVGGQLRCYYYIGGPVVKSTRAYNATTHRFLRLRHASGVVYWDVSTNGKTWTNLDSLSTGVDLSSVIAEIAINSGGTGVSFDNFNLYRDLILPAISSTAVTYSPALKQVVATPLISSSNALYLPTIVDQKILRPPVISSSEALYTPIVLGPPTVLSFGFISSTLSLFAISITLAPLGSVRPKMATQASSSGPRMPSNEARRSPVMYYRSGRR